MDLENRTMMKEEGYREAKKEAGERSGGTEAKERSREDCEGREAEGKPWRESAEREAEPVKFQKEVGGLRTAEE